MIQLTTSIILYTLTILKYFLDTCLLQWKYVMLGVCKNHFSNHILFRHWPWFSQGNWTWLIPLFNWPLVLSSEWFFLLGFLLIFHVLIHFPVIKLSGTDETFFRSFFPSDHSLFSTWVVSCWLNFLLFCDELCFSHAESDWNRLMTYSVHYWLVFVVFSCMFSFLLAFVCLLSAASLFSFDDSQWSRWKTHWSQCGIVIIGFLLVSFFFGISVSFFDSFFFFLHRNFSQAVYWLIQLFSDCGLFLVDSFLIGISLSYVGTNFLVLPMNVSGTVQWQIPVKLA